MERFPFLAQRMFNTPVLIHPAKAEVIVAALADRLGIGAMVRVNGDVVVAGERADSGSFGAPARRERRECGYEIAEGVAIISIEGTLVQKLGTLRPYSGMTGYDGIREVYFSALADPEVRGIALDIRSPGGEAAGCFDLADAIYQSRGEKPVWAILNEYAYSAAYALACAADRIVLPRTGGVGSIGAYYMHVDFSQALKDAGIKVTFIAYGERKLDRQPAIPLSKEALERVQADIDFFGELFVETVARNRNLAAKKVRDTEAATLRADEGVALGLADAVMAPDAAFRALLDELA